MTTMQNPTSYILEGFIRCGECGDRLEVRPLGETNILTYQCSTCDKSQPDPSVTADELERWIIRQVTETVLTESNTAMMTQEMAAEGASLPDNAPEALRYPERFPDQVRAMATDPATLLTRENVSHTRQLMTKLIAFITLGDQEAMIHYALPLPHDSALAGEYRQHIPLPHDGLQ